MSEPQQVISSDGRRGVILGESNPSHDDPRFIRVRMEGGTILQVPAELLTLRPDGTFHLRVGMADVESAALNAHNAREGRAGQGSPPEARRIVLPVVVEELEIDRRTTTTGLVRVHKHVHEREEVVDETVAREEVRVEQVPIGQMVDTPPAMHSEGSTLVIPILEEVLIVEKRLRLKEEVRLTWQRIVEPAPQRLTLRDEELTVERIAPMSLPRQAMAPLNNRMPGRPCLAVS